MFYIKAVLKTFAIFTCVGVSFSCCRPSGLQLYEKETAAQVFPCEYWKTFMVNYFEENLRTAASVLLIIKLISIGHLLNFSSVWDIWWDGFYEERLQICSEYVLYSLSVENTPTFFDD